MRVTILELFLSCIALAELSASASSLKVTQTMPWPSRSPDGQKDGEKIRIWNLETLEGKEGCITQLDLVFVVDGSSSIKDHNFEEVRHFVSEFIGSIPVSAEGVHTSVVLYSTDVTVVWDLAAPVSADSEGAQLLARQLQQPGGKTNTAKAFDVAYDILFGIGSGARANAPKVVLLLTDGMSNRPPDTIRAAERLREQGVVIVALGVGRHINKRECREIVGCARKDNSCDLFKESEWEKLVQNIRPMLEAVCTTLPQDAQCGEWSEWSVCSATCGAGTQVSYREEISPPVDGTPTCPTCSPPKGRSCEDQGGLKRERDCHVQDCDADAGCGEWGPWGPWSGTCGSATRSRSRQTYNEPPPIGDGRLCQFQDPPKYPSDTESKDLGPCRTDCVLSDWGPCEKCVNGFGTRFRYMVRKDDSTVPCGESAVESETCSDCWESGDAGIRSADDDAHTFEGHLPNVEPFDAADYPDDTLRDVYPHYPEEPRAVDTKDSAPVTPVDEGLSSETSGDASTGQGSDALSGGTDATHGSAPGRDDGLSEHPGESYPEQSEQAQQAGTEDQSHQPTQGEQSGEEKVGEQPQRPGEEKKEDEGTSAATIAGGVIGGLILASAAAGGGYYYFKGGEDAASPSELHYDEPAGTKEAFDEEREAMVSVDGESNMWADQ